MKTRQCSYLRRLGLFFLAICIPQLAIAQSPADKENQQQVKSKIELTGQVFVKQAQLEKLLRKPSSRPAPNWTPLQAFYTGKIQKDSLQLKARLQLRVNRSGSPVKVLLKGANALLLSLRVNGAVRTVGRQNNTHYITLSKGKYLLQFVYQFPLRKVLGENVLGLDLPSFPKASMQMSLPGTGWALYTSPKSHIEIKEYKGKSTAKLQLPGSGNFSLRWKGRRLERQVKARFRVQAETMVTLQEGLLLGKSSLRYQFLTGSSRTLRFQASKKLEILHVSGKGVMEWYQDKKNNAKHNTIVVQLARSVRKQQTLKIRFERTNIPLGKPVQLPRIFVLKAEQFSGLLGVSAQADTEVSHDRALDAKEIDVRALPRHFREKSELPILLAYSFEKSTHQAQVKVTKHPRVSVLSIVVNRAHFETVFRQDGQEVTKATYHVVNNRRQYMPLKLPPGSKLLGAFVAGRAVQPAQPDTKALPRTSVQQTMPASIQGRYIEYLIPLIRSKGKTKRTFQVEVLYTRQQMKMGLFGRAGSELPSTPLEVLRYTWSYYMPKSQWPLWFEGSLQPRHRKRFIRHIIKRLEADWKAGTPNVWAGGRSFNKYNSSGLKERFASPSSDLNGRSKRYKSPYAKAQWQIRAQVPLIGRHISFQGQLLRGKAPQLRYWYMKKSLTSYWFWFVLCLSTLLCLLFMRGLFHQKGVRWWSLAFSLFGGGALIILGYLIPMTYLAGFRGGMYGFWFACLIRLGTTPPKELYTHPIYIVLMRWYIVGLTLLIFLTDSVAFQFSVMFFAIPIYPALIRRGKKSFKKASKKAKKESEEKAKEKSEEKTEVEKEQSE